MSGQPLQKRGDVKDDAFWKELLGASAGGKKSEAQNLKELGF